MISVDETQREERRNNLQTIMQRVLSSCMCSMCRTYKYIRPSYVVLFYNLKIFFCFKVCFEIRGTTYFHIVSIKLNLHRHTFFIKVKKHANIVSKTRMSLKISKTEKLPDKIVPIFNFFPSLSKMQIFFLKNTCSPPFRFTGNTHVHS